MTSSKFTRMSLKEGMLSNDWEFKINAEYENSYELINDLKIDYF